MKLAQILATSPLPGGSPARLEPASVDPVAAGLTDISKAATSLSETASTEALRAQRLLAAAEREKEKHQQALDASTAVNSALDTLDQAEQVFKMGQRDETTGEITVAPLSSKDYMPAWLTLREKVTQDALAKATTPEAKLVTAKLLETPFRERQHAARKYSNDLYVGQYTVGVEENLDSYAKRTLLEPENAPYWETRAMAELAVAEGVKGPEWVRTRAEKWQVEVDTAKVRELARTDPEAAITALEGGKYRLPEDRRQQMITGTYTKWQANVREEEAASKRRSEEWEKAWHGYQSTQHVEDYVAVRNGDLTVEQIVQNAREWHYTTAQTKELLDLHDKPAKETKEVSNQGVLLRYTADVNGLKPKTTESDLKASMANGDLTIKDGGELLAKLTARTRQEQVDARQLASEGRTAATEARTQLKYDQAEAERQLRAGLGIPDILPPGFSPEVAAAYSQAQQQLANRSAAYPSQGGKENPLTVVRQIIPEAQRSAGLYGRVKEQDLIKLLPPDLAAMASESRQGFYTASRIFDSRRKQLGEAEFGRISHTFTELWALYRDMEAAGAFEKKPTPSTATPPATYQVPKAPKGSK